jgi:hypothetical protein
MSYPVSTGLAVLLLALNVFAPFAAAQLSKPSPAFSWAPPDIDYESPLAKTDAPCPLDTVLPAASKRVVELVEHMQQFSATENVKFEELNHKGSWGAASKATFTYVAYIHEIAPQQLSVEEFRNDSVALDFPSKLATTGTAAFALIFHPNYLKDFDVTCEGLTSWNGRPAWRLHLVQTKVDNFRGYRSTNGYFPVMLKARAWIDADNFEVLRLETNLRDPIPQIQLKLEHVIVEYAAVDFPKKNAHLWLPQSAEIYMDFRGRRYHHEHTFSHFQLFSVDTSQTVHVPK